MESHGDGLVKGMPCRPCKKASNLVQSIQLEILTYFDDHNVLEKLCSWLDSTGTVPLGDLIFVSGFLTTMERQGEYSSTHSQKHRQYSP